MKRISTKQTVMLGLLVGIGFLASGCQTTRTSDVANLDNDRFMSLWHSYNECKVASDFGRAHFELKQLSSAVSTKRLEGEEGFVLPLPTKLQRLVSPPTSRMAVDLQAMTASCSLHAGQLALHEGHVDVAREMFSSVFALPNDLSPYYTLQAKRFLTELDRGVTISLKTP